jgi:DNA-binding transcriptional ArsR family regulator
MDQPWREPDYRRLSEKLKLLAHPERLRILDVLRREPECVCHLEALRRKLA